MKPHVWFLVGAGALGVASAFETRLSVFAFLLLVIAMASLTRFEHPRKRGFAVLLTGASLLSLVGMTRFITGEALPGIIDARGRASGRRAVSLLREILTAQNAARRYAMIDPDGDGVGSAGRLGELSGTQGARQGSPLPTPPLAPRFAPRVGTAVGPATSQDGYLFVICLPGLDQDWVTHPAASVDEERAERRWVAYAWPASAQSPHSAAFFIDEHERILESANQKDGSRRLVGPGGAPTCNDVDDHPGQWQPWRGKKPVDELPGLNGK